MIPFRTFRSRTRSDSWPKTRRPRAARLMGRAPELCEGTEPWEGVELYEAAEESLVSFINRSGVESPNAFTTLLYPQVPGSTTFRARTSASMMGREYGAARSRLETLDLPVTSEPVRPIVIIVGRCVGVVRGVVTQWGEWGKARVLRGTKGRTGNGVLGLQVK